ncbi:DUF6186 family protein [Blastococcus saxobsidens]|uniref:Uncharacterized protein n=1 Tax=Blastococcus saxobsidens (strain DD2) TaxID=1146883 RepID=H6RKP7_BLASD|nr:DUF6186 family protein [Blastococcus saxobsidens]CCG03663.1 conserved exported protein of unknown function [Blastococcus saxobsidens DD2]
MSGTATSITGFTVLALLATVIEVRARRGTGPVTAADAVAAAMRTTPGRLAVLAAWVWLGVHFLAR